VPDQIKNGIEKIMSASSSILSDDSAESLSPPPAGQGCLNPLPNNARPDNKMYRTVDRSVPVNCRNVPSLCGGKLVQHRLVRETYPVDVSSELYAVNAL